MVVPDLSFADLEGLLRVWPTAAACPSWRLWGESPSFARLRVLRSQGELEQVVRDDRGRPTGMLQLRDVDRANGCGTLGFLLPTSADRVAPPSILAFAEQGRARLELRKVSVIVDEDMLEVLADVVPHLTQVGVLREHSLVRVGRYVDRHLFELPPPDQLLGTLAPSDP